MDELFLLWLYPKYPRCEVAVAQLWGPLSLLRPFQFPAVQKGVLLDVASPKRILTPPLLNFFLLSPFVSGLNYPVGGAFHQGLPPPFHYRRGLAALCQEGHSFSGREWKKRKYTSTVWLTKESATWRGKLFFSKAVQSSAGLYKIAHRGFLWSIPHSCRIKTFLASILLSLLEWSVPPRWDGGRKAHLKGFNGREPPANPILICWC